MTTDPPTSAAWVTLGDHRVRVDQIAAWRDTYYNGWQHYVYVTLTTGKEVSGQVTPEQWAAFEGAVSG